MNSERPKPIPARLPRWKRGVLGAAIALGSFVAIGGAMHMPFARGLLMRIGGCPMAAEVSPKELDKAHQGALAQDRGTERAPAQPAFGFDLGSTTRAQVLAWAARAKVSCEKDRGNLLRCDRVQASAVGGTLAEGTLTSLSIGFNANDRVVDVSSMRMHQTPSAALAALTDITSALEGALGAPHRQVGAFDLEHLSRKGVAGLSTASYHFRDYVAELTTMSFDTDGLVVREHYAVILDGS